MSVRVGLVPHRKLEDPRLALEPLALRLGDVVSVRSEHVEHKTAAGQEQIVGGVEDGQPVLVRVHVQQGAEWTDHQRDAFGDRRLAQIAHAQVERDPCKRGSARTHLEHRARRVDPDHADPVGTERHGDTPSATPSSTTGPPERRASSR